MKPTNLKWILFGSLTVYLLLLMFHPLPIAESDLGLRIQLGGLNFSDIQYNTASFYSEQSATLLEKIAFYINQWTGLIGYHLLNIILVISSFLIMIGQALKQAKNQWIISLIALFCIPFIAMEYKEIHSSVTLFIIALFSLVALTYFNEDKRPSVTGLVWIVLLITISMLLNKGPLALFDDIYKILFYSGTWFGFTSDFSNMGKATSLIGWALTVLLVLGFYLNREQYSTRSYLVYLALTIFGFLVSYFSLSVNALALVTIPVLSYHLSHWWSADPNSNRLISYQSPLLALFILLPLIWVSGLWHPFKKPIGLGAGSSMVKPAKFFTENSLVGPVFNNQLSGSYLAYYLAPTEKLYTAPKVQDFSKQSFSNDNYWNQENERYKFNVLFYRLNGETTEALTFLGRRLAERDQWALVYFEEGEWAILLKRNEKNAQLIDRFEKI